MDKALSKVSKLLGEQAAQMRWKHFQRIQNMPGANRVFQRIASAPEKEQLADYLAEIQYALIFAGLGFQVEIEPWGNKGPDLRISRAGQQAIVEIMRFRKVYPGPLALDPSDDNSVLLEYGNPQRDIRKSFEKILAKFPQVDDHRAIIAIWNDDATCIATTQNYFFPHLEFLLRATLDIIGEVYQVEPFEEMTFVYRPSNRKIAAQHIDFENVYIGLSGKRRTKPPLCVRIGRLERLFGSIRRI